MSFRNYFILCMPSCDISNSSMNTSFVGTFCGIKLHLVGQQFSKFHCDTGIPESSFKDMVIFF